MKKLNLSGFDIGIIIAFAVVALLGGGAWWYLSGALQDAQAEVTNAKADFDKYSIKYHIVVSASNGKALQDNIDLLKAQLDPLILTKLLPKENKLGSIAKEDPVAWKHDLDDEVQRLDSAAKLHGVTLPPNFYFGFSRYIGQSPSDEQTAVLSKQLVGIEQIATILINAPVKNIQAMRRTYEEEPHGAPGGAAIASSGRGRMKRITWVVIRSMPPGTLTPPIRSKSTLKRPPKICARPSTISCNPPTFSWYAPSPFKVRSPIRL